MEFLKEFLEINTKIKQEEIKKFLTLPGEELILATRRHWIVIVYPLLATVLGSFIVLVTAYWLFTITFDISEIFILTALIILVFSLLAAVKSFFDWYYHLYIVTTRKVLEVSYSPLLNRNINQLLLDQVRTTEVDVKMCNMVDEFLNKGEVIIVFDQLSRIEKFHLKDIAGAQNVGIYLGHMLEYLMLSNQYQYRAYEQRSPEFYYPRGAFV